MNQNRFIFREVRTFVDSPTVPCFGILLKKVIGCIYCAWQSALFRQHSTNFKMALELASDILQAWFQKAV